MKIKWSTKEQVGRYEVSWTSKDKKYAQTISASSEDAAARHARQVCHAGAYGTIQVRFLG